MKLRPPFDTRVFLTALAGGAPGVAVSLALLWTGDHTAKVQWTLTAIVVGVWLGCAMTVRDRVVYSLQTISNLLAALREGDYSIRARGARGSDSLAEVMMEVNELGETLREQRLGALEATALLRTVMAEIDVAVFAFDNERSLRLVNRSGERLLGQRTERLLGRQAGDLGLGECLDGEPARTLQMTFPGGDGRWGMRRGVFREHGVPHQLLVLTDLSRALREEERAAWQRLIRVLGHELNNSLTPIKSIAGSLERILQRDPRPGDWEEDMARGLAVIASRSESLSRFMGAYARLARLPQPRFGPVDVGEWVGRVARLETRSPVVVEPGPPVVVSADADQLEQLLINLVRNAVDASAETGGSVTVGWALAGSEVEVWVRDEGMGLADTANLFVPFFTTKPAGSGIGLVLSRQIAEAHGGSLSLENRQDGHQGCRAALRIPA